MLELLKLQNQEQVKNTFYRAPKVTPSINLKEEYLEVKTLEKEVKLGKLEEVILWIIADFKFAPFWLIQQWYEDFNIKDHYTIIASWIEVGLVWAEATALGVFIRPTKLLLDLMHIEDQSYTQIPFNLLNHTCSEEQIVFEIQSGNPQSELWNIIRNEKTLPCFHPLQIKPVQDDGTIAIREASFTLNRYNTEKLIEGERQLNLSIESGVPFTAEFNDFSLFPIISTKDNGDLITQTPDIIIPIPRENKLPRSCAIELELSAKSPARYDQIMLNYKNNSKFGKLFYLCSQPRIAKLVKEAYTRANGLGSCKLYIVSFTSPAMSLTNFDLKDIQHQKNLIEEVNLIYGGGQEEKLKTTQDNQEEE